MQETVIQQFIAGDPTEIHEVFTKSNTHSTGGVAEGQLQENLLNCEMNSLVHALADRISTLEIDPKKQKKRM